MGVSKGERGDRNPSFLFKIFLSLFLLTLSHTPSHLFSLLLGLPLSHRHSLSLTGSLTPSPALSLSSPHPSGHATVLSPLLLFRFEFGKCEVLMLLTNRLFISECFLVKTMYIDIGS